MPARKPSLIVRAALVWSGVVVFVPLALVLICDLLSDWRTYVALACLSIVAYLAVHDRRPRDRRRDGSIERTPYELTSVWNRRRP